MKGVPIHLEFQFPHAELLNDYIENFKVFSDNYENVASFDETKYKIYNEYNYQYFRNKVYNFIIDEAVGHNVFAVRIMFKDKSKNQRFDVLHYNRLREELESQGYKVEYQGDYKSMTISWCSGSDLDKYDLEYEHVHGHGHGYINLPQEIEEAIKVKDKGVTSSSIEKPYVRKSERLRKRRRVGY